MTVRCAPALSSLASCCCCRGRCLLGAALLPAAADAMVGPPLKHELAIPDQQRFDLTTDVTEHTAGASLTGAAGEAPLLWPLPLHEWFTIVHDAGAGSPSSARLPAMVARFARAVAVMGGSANQQQLVAPADGPGGRALRQLQVRVVDQTDADAPPTVRTNYSYTLGPHGNATVAAAVAAASVFGAIYGLESFFAPAAAASAPAGPNSRRCCARLAINIISAQAA